MRAKNKISAAARTRSSSVLWSVDRREFQRIILAATSLADVLRYFGLHVGAGNYKTLKRRIRQDGVSLGGIKTGLASNSGRVFPGKKKLEDYLVVGCVLSKGIKKKLVVALGNVCSLCPQGPTWNGKPLSLQIDHINGDTQDNRRKNLRVACPNCHSQTATFAGRNARGRIGKARSRRCMSCPKVVSGSSFRCRGCSAVFQRKVARPTKGVLKRLLIAKIPMTTIGKQFGVSDNAVRKWCHSYGLSSR